MRRIVVVGAGLAGHRTAVALRERGFTGDLTVVGDEVHRPYDRPPLSKQLLAGAFAPGDLVFADVDVTWRLGSAAVGLDVGARRVLLADGGEVPYDGLVIASGRRARPWPGPAPSTGVHLLRSLDDALALRASVGPGSAVAIVGAGFIGCEVAATLRGLGVERVTMIDIAATPMPVLGPEVGARAAELHRAHGVDLRLGHSVRSIDGSPAVRSVTLGTGERVAADHVLVAMGSSPNSGWLAGSGIALMSGTVVCDGAGRVVADDGAVMPGIVAAGDVASRPHRPGAEPSCVEHWSNARDTAVAAACALLGESGAAVGIPTFWSDQYDVKIKSAGFLRSADRFVVVEEDPARPSLVVEAHRGSVLVGAVVFNRNKTIIGYQRALAPAA